MMNYRFDMHIHSHNSPDGVMTLEEIAVRARAAGLDGVAVCDHNRTLPADELRRAADAFPNFLFIPGVELSTEYGHLLGWFVTEPVSADNFPEAVDAIRRQGGVAVLAHPFEHTKSAEKAEAALPYLDGVEIWNSRAERKNRQANAMARAWAAEHGLRGFAGSDAHTVHEVGAGVTTVPADALSPEAVKTGLLSGAASADGRRSKAVWAAVSQLTRRRKTGAGPLSYCKWALFAVKCVLEDAFRP